MNNALFSIRARLHALETITTSAAALRHVGSMRRSINLMQGLSNLLSQQLSDRTQPTTPTDAQGGRPMSPAQVRPRTAVLSVTNARRSSLVTQVLLSAGITVMELAKGGVAADLWVTQPSTAALLEARRRVRAAPATTIILLGVAAKAARAQWNLLNAVAVRDADDFELVRDAVVDVQQRWTRANGGAL
jgi:hypothetical protein